MSAGKMASNLFAKTDNMEFMKTLPEKSLDFIYIDPPFNTDAIYKTGSCAGKNDAYEDKWSGGLTGYLDMLKPRIEEMRRLLKDSGTIAIHLDWHAVHYVKVMCDGIFGMNNFVNELIWTYKSGGAGKKSFAKKHDTILVYSNTSKYYFKPQKEKSYNRGFKPYRFKGVEEYADEQGRWYTLVNHRDVFNIDMVGRTSKERTGYPTQKPEALMSMLLEGFCPEGGRCGDFFAGSGSLAASAVKSGRSFVCCDLGDEAFRMAKARLSELSQDIDWIE